MENGKRLTEVQLRRLSMNILQAAGAKADRAHTVTDHLVMANLTGHDSHGVIRLTLYCTLMRDGLLHPAALPRRVSTSSGMDIFDGQYGFGQVVAMHILIHAMHKARKRGSFSVAFCRSSHVGRLGYYTSLAANYGFLALLMVNGPAGDLQSHPDSILPLFGTNPISFAVKWEDELLLVDTTTSTRAEGKVMLLRNKGKRTPPGWLKNNRGRPTRDPNDLYAYPRGSFWPLGGPESGYKGFCLALMIDCMAGLWGDGQLAGSKVPRGGNNGWLHLIHLPRFIKKRSFQQRMGPWIQRLREAPTISGEPLVLPGDPENQAYRDRFRNGVLIDAGTWQQLTELAGRLRVSLAEF